MAPPRSGLTCRRKVVCDEYSGHSGIWSNCQDIISQSIRIYAGKFRLRPVQSSSSSAAAGRGAILVKMDIEAAYCLVPVHPQDKVLQWEGLCSALKIFDVLAGALHWHQEFPACFTLCRTTQFSSLGVRNASHKTGGPATTLTHNKV